MEKFFFRYYVFSWLVLLGFSSSIFASNFQSFSGLCYSNPAELPFLVKDLQIILGNTWASPDIAFNGTVTVANPVPQFPPVISAGASPTIANYNMPYGRAAQRFADGLILDVDVTTPFYKDIIYATDSSVRYAATVSKVDSVDVAPNIAYKLAGPLSDWSIGAGFDALHLYVELDQQYPSLPKRTSAPPFLVPFGAGSDVNVAEKASAWAYGWHSGIVYHPLEGTFFGLSYFSQITPNTTGISSFTGFPDSNRLSATADLPATSNFDITQYFSKDWLVRLQVHYTQWSRLKAVILENTAGPENEVDMPTNYRDTWRVDLISRLDVTPKINVGALVAVDETPTNNIDRSIRLPEGNELIIGMSLGYKLTKTFSVEGSCGHLFTITPVPINHFLAGANVTSIGDGYVSGNAVALRLTYNT